MAAENPPSSGLSVGAQNGALQVPTPGALGLLGVKNKVGGKVHPASPGPGWPAALSLGLRVVSSPERFPPLLFLQALTSAEEGASPSF